MERGRQIRNASPRGLLDSKAELQAWDLSSGLYLVINLLSCEIKQINRFGLNFSAFAEILQNDARWMVSQKESFKFHF